ncbi:uncharacterized protein TNCT_422981 [Trichonephila clavata]|uniref:Apple domain-containing protein n=1 Tax=Trichonephila clavata TaxID=2740835 RepID=A0A8X6J822_TRICU|nr:uncharacterized protein TNCT_422981 [Trichonephila clavata]
MPPIGIGCPLRKSYRTIPDIPPKFSYSAEVYDILKAEESEIADVEFQKVWYDSNHSIARLDKFTRLRYTSELYDFNTGVTYSNIDDETCTIQPLRNSFFEGYDGKLMGHLKEPGEVLNLDGKFYYMGKRLIRGIWADSYESIQTDVAFMKKDLAKLVVTVFFSPDYYEVAVDGETETRIPIYYIITGWDTPTHIAINLQYNIHAFDDYIWPAMYETFQLERCFPTMETKSYFLLLLNTDAELAGKMEAVDDIVKQALRLKIREIAKVSDMRIPLLSIDYKSTGVFVTALMLERPPALAQFTLEYEGEVRTPDPDVRVIPAADSKEQCAYACVDERKFTCTGFYFCKQACFIKSQDILEPADKDTKYTELGVCQTWLRAESQSTNKEPYLVNALEWLEKAVLNDSFKIPIALDERTNVVVPVNDIVIGDGPYTGDNNQEKPYTTVINFAKLKSDDETTEDKSYVDNINDCYKECKNSESMSCASFSYCGDSDNKQCKISSVLVVDRQHNPKDTEDDKNCHVYSMKYLDFFNPYPGRVVLISGDDVYPKITAVEDCAKLCREEKKFNCRGFEYCRTAKTCVLHSKHVLDLKDGEFTITDQKSTCTHYAAKFTADYYDMGYTLIDDNSDSRTEITLEDCARTCSEELKLNCKSFNYCPASGPYMTDSTCSLSTKILTDAKITTTTKDKCKHYEKKTTVDDWARKTTKPLLTSGYTSKGFTGLVIGMLALGLVLGAMGFVLYSYLRSRSSGEGMTVRFMKSDI